MPPALVWQFKLKTHFSTQVWFPIIRKLILLQRSFSFLAKFKGGLFYFFFKVHPINCQDRETGTCDQIHFSWKDFSKNPNILHNCTEQFWSTAPCYKFSWIWKCFFFFVENFLDIWALACVFVLNISLEWARYIALQPQTAALSNSAADMTLTELPLVWVLVHASTFILATGQPSPRGHTPRKQFIIIVWLLLYLLSW